ncbi:MAG: hypothetical protein GON13_03010, partial [Nanoarchaeota archaeon]|nr:hypothetical protein [Nanoarchaeota archaeon]
NPAELLEEFISWFDNNSRLKKVKRKEANLRQIFGWKKTLKIRPCVKFIMSDEFKQNKDGFNRGMFILINELKKVLGESQARIIINDWNKSIDNEIREQDIEYRLGAKDYNLPCLYVHKFLENVGFDVKNFKKNC